MTLLLFTLLAALALLAVATPIIKGITTINWGVGDVPGTGLPAGAIATAGTITPKNGEPIEIEDTNGIAAALVFLPDGFNAELSFVYDGAKVWPDVAATQKPIT
jgi:hypothetical protein